MPLTVWSPLKSSRSLTLAKMRRSSWSTWPSMQFITTRFSFTACLCSSSSSMASMHLASQRLTSLPLTRAQRLNQLCPRQFERPTGNCGSG
jgi:hypothetical protein